MAPLFWLVAFGYVETMADLSNAMPISSCAMDIRSAIPIPVGTERNDPVRRWAVWKVWPNGSV